MTSGKTGEKCELSGIYYCHIHTSYEITISKGETFPPCNGGGDHGTTWKLKTAARTH